MRTKICMLIVGVLLVSSVYVCASDVVISYKTDGWVRFYNSAGYTSQIWVGHPYDGNITVGDVLPDSINTGDEVISYNTDGWVRFYNSAGYISQIWVGQDEDNYIAAGDVLPDSINVGDEVISYNTDGWVRFYSGYQQQDLGWGPINFISQIWVGQDENNYIAVGDVLPDSVNAGDEVISYNSDGFVRFYNSAGWVSQIWVGHPYDGSITVGDVLPDSVNAGDEVISYNTDGWVRFYNSAGYISQVWVGHLAPFNYDNYMTAGDVLSANAGDEIISYNVDGWLRFYTGGGVLLPGSLSLDSPYDQHIVVGNVPPTIEAIIDLDPDTLNLKSKGQYVTASVYDANGVAMDVASAKIAAVDGMETYIPSEFTDGEMVKFNRADLQEELSVGDTVVISLEGTLTNGSHFKGNAAIRVIDKGKRK